MPQAALLQISIWLLTASLFNREQTKLLIPVEERVLLQTHGLLGPTFLQAAAAPCPYLHHLLVELAQHVLPYGLVHEDTQIRVGEPATPHALLFCHTAGKKREWWMWHAFSIEEASAQAGLEKTLLKVYGRELQSLAKAHRYPNLLFHYSRTSSEQGQSQGCTVDERLTLTPIPHTYRPSSQLSTSNSSRGSV